MNSIEPPPPDELVYRLKAGEIPYEVALVTATLHLTR